VLHMCPVSNSTLTASRQYCLLWMCASHIRVMPDNRYDGAGHIIIKQNEQRIYGNEWCRGQRRTYCTKYNMTWCIQCCTLYQVKFWVTNMMNGNFLHIMLLVWNCTSNR
jgi:hypothetical protein